MTFLLLKPELIGGFYLILLLAFSAVVCVFFKLCVYYYKSAIAKPPEPVKEPKRPQREKKPTKPRTPVRKIIINPNEINRIYVKEQEK